MSWALQESEDREKVTPLSLRWYGCSCWWAFPQTPISQYGLSNNFAKGLGTTSSKCLSGWADFWNNRREQWREVNLLISFIFIFLSDNTVNSIETRWMCFHVCRMMPNVGFCSRSFSREIALIPDDTFITVCPIFLVLLWRVFVVCPLQESRPFTFVSILIHCLRVTKKKSEGLSKIYT